MTNHANNQLKAKSLSEEASVTRARYNRIAPIYDLMDFLPEQRFAGWRKQLWGKVVAGRILEVGVGTGKNFPYHPAGAEVTGIDLSERMLAQARRKVEKSGYALDLRQMDAQQLDFPDNTFEVAVATFVFCSVPDAERGLRELARVVRPDGVGHYLLHPRHFAFPRSFFVTANKLTRSTKNLHYVRLINFFLIGHRQWCNSTRTLACCLLCYC